jgi:AcrR family transcriptional regulator
MMRLCRCAVYPVGDVEPVDPDRSARVFHVSSECSEWPEGAEGMLVLVAAAGSVGPRRGIQRRTVPDIGDETSACGHAGMYRARILTAMVDVVADHGFAGSTVKLVTARASVSTRTFYEHFDDLEHCFTAVLVDGTQPILELIRRAFEGTSTWLDAVRSVLASLLMFLDVEPRLARVWLVESLASGPRALECRERLMGEILAAIVEPWSVADVAYVPPLAPQGSFASVLGIVVAHLVARSPEPLIDLLGPLSGVAVAPYLDQSEVARQIERGTQLARRIQAGDPRWFWVRDLIPRTARTHTPGNARRGRAWECLLFLADHPGASNREVAVGIGVSHRSQISKLLHSLAGAELVSKCSEGPGKRNAWRVTQIGLEVSQQIPVGIGAGLRASFRRS